MLLNGLSISPVVVGVFIIIGGVVMFGDIGRDALIGVLSGYGFILVDKALKNKFCFT